MAGEANNDVLPLTYWETYLNAKRGIEGVVLNLKQLKCHE